MSTIEEAREQAREALELIHKWRQREQAWDTPRALDFERIGVSIRALLDATEPQETTTPAAKSQLEAVTNAIEKVLDGQDALHCTRVWEAWGYGTMSEDDFSPVTNDAEAVNEIASAVLEALEPRPITDEMVESAARVMFDAPDGMTGDYTWAEMVSEDPSRADLWRADARAALEAAEEARR